MKNRSLSISILKSCAKHYLQIITLAFLTLAFSLHCFAVLGGSEASVVADQAHMQASLQSTSSAGYTVHELRAPTGIVVREYVAGGTVFGIAWQGPWPPDMTQLLGSYFGPYQQALQAQNSNRVGRRPIHIQISGLVVNSSGHPRSFRGHAYVPDLLPQGVSAEAIQ
jgi:hypothetical protein